MGFSGEEKQELLIATLIFTLVELSTIIGSLQFISVIIGTSYLTIILFLIILGSLTAPLFLLHELGHRQAAIHFNMGSYFKLDKNMAIFSLFSILLPIKIIAPGVVITHPKFGSSNKSGEISLAGPLVNLFISGIGLSILYFFPILDFLSLLLIFFIKYSLDIAIFNLLPFSVLDGKKIFDWNQPLFLVVFGVTILIWLYFNFQIIL